MDMERKRRVAELECEVEELRSANEILRKVVRYFASDTERSWRAEEATSEVSYSRIGRHPEEGPQVRYLRPCRTPTRRCRRLLERRQGAVAPVQARYPFP